MPDHTQLLRTLNLIRLLTDRPGKTVAQLARLLAVTTRTVYRYLETLEAVGYAVDVHPQTKQYFLFEADAKQRTTFTADESALVSRLLTALPTEHPLTDSIRRKLFVTSELLPFADELQDRHRAVLVERLADALRTGRQVRLLRYHSANSNTITDRLVEPLELIDNYATLKAYDPGDGKEKTFKIKRIEDVAVLEQRNVHAPTVAAQLPVDAFGMDGPEPLLVVLYLNRRAYHLLLEERPLTRPYLEPRPHDADFPYQFRGEVRDWRGIGRFVLGMADQVRVIEPDPFKAFLKEKLGSFNF
ncbi:helix-turn-helix transcriptional regulator [Fibrella aquatilis]|uniref:WYL domain-containing protein n=1 Tax=Fibrella aquatilis TaxID=2817059 RepID=A0A939JWM4_9BACT|nr:WYL domain-containing protein [Fibrella aquatilis]MBO0932062.1 WYL domain-containing protein [Fibrella aquatilis]